MSIGGLHGLKSCLRAVRENSKPVSLYGEQHHRQTLLFSSRWRCREKKWHKGRVAEKKSKCTALASDGSHENGANNTAEALKTFTVAMKFGGTSVGSAERMKCIADIITSFPDEFPVVVLSAMGKTTNLLLTVCTKPQSVAEDMTHPYLRAQPSHVLQAGEDARTCSDPDEVCMLPSLQEIRRLHFSAAMELEVNESAFCSFLDELEKLLVGICLMKELTPRAKDYLVSFGERISTRLFAAYLQSIGIRSKQYV